MDCVPSVLEIQLGVGKKRANNVTLICVAGVQVHKALIAILKSVRQLKFDEVKLVTPRLRQLKIGRFSVERPIESRLDSLVEYNKYVLFELMHHVTTSHCLIIQADGYVINGTVWTDDFCSYDYIGAPWPIEKEKYIDPFGVNQRVGNGGFSLRSKKLLEIPRKVEIPWEVNIGNFYKHFNQNSYSEDGNICVHNRHIYEREGCKFAPLEVAAIFSRELDIPDVIFNDTLGFHRYRPKRYRRFDENIKGILAWWQDLMKSLLDNK